METVLCRHCENKEIVIKIDGKSFTTFVCKKCDKQFTLKNN